MTRNTQTGLTSKIDAGFEKLEQLHRAYDRAQARAGKMPNGTHREKLDRSCAFIRARLKYEHKILNLAAQLAKATR
jgi:hypothetical protein